MSAELFDIDQQSVLIRQCYQQAKLHPARIVFPDAIDIRVLRAARYLQQQRLAQPILLANPFSLREEALKRHFPLDGLLIIDPADESPYAGKFVTYLKGKVRAKDQDDVATTIKQPLWFAALMLATGEADYCIAGNLSSTASVLRAGLKVIGLRDDIKTLSSIFIMLPKGEGQPLGFADCGVVPQPTAAQLADIAISSAENFEKITGQTAKVAMLSFSTKGSAKHPCVANVQQATDIIRERQPSLCIDGELQFDAAFVPEVGQLKAPGSVVAGQANVFIFPSLEAGNIGYKIAQRLGGYSAIGPLVQGLNAPMHDLSRGCSYQEIIELALVTMTQRHSSMQ